MMVGVAPDPKGHCRDPRSNYLLSSPVPPIDTVANPQYHHPPIIAILLSYRLTQPKRHSRS